VYRQICRRHHCFYQRVYPQRYRAYRYYPMSYDPYDGGPHFVRVYNREGLSIEYYSPY
jgi:hypothetical protein